MKKEKEKEKEKELWKTMNAGRNYFLSIKPMFYKA